MPFRSVKPDMKTIRNAKSSLKSYGWYKQAAMLEGLKVDKLLKELGRF